MFIIKLSTPYYSAYGSRQNIYCVEGNEGRFFGKPNCEKGEIVGEVTSDKLEYNNEKLLMYLFGVTLFIVSLVLLFIINLRVYILNRKTNIKNG